MGLVLNIAFYGFIFVLSLFFQREQGRSPLATGLAFAPMTGIVLAANLGAGRPGRVVRHAARDRCLGRDRRGLVRGTARDRPLDFVCGDGR